MGLNKLVLVRGFVYLDLTSLGLRGIVDLVSSKLQLGDIPYEKKT